MGIIMTESSTDNVRNERQKTKDGKCKESDNSSPERWTVIDYQTQLFQHHNVDKGLAIGSVQVRNPVSLFLSVPLLHVYLSDFVFLILELVLDFPELSFLFAFDELLFSLGRQVVSETHSQSIADEDWDSDGEYVRGRGSCSDTTQNDGKGINNAIQASVDGRFKVLANLDMFLFVWGMLWVRLADSVCAEERLFVSVWHVLFGYFCWVLIKNKYVKMD
jgi:hypothetical protein